MAIHIASCISSIVDYNFIVHNDLSSCLYRKFSYYNSAILTVYYDQCSNMFCDRLFDKYHRNIKSSMTLGHTAFKYGSRHSSKYDTEIDSRIAQSSLR